MERITVTYNLLDEPWIPCILSNGKRIELGIRELFTRAQEIRAVDDPSPLTTIALHRLLLAILYRVFQVKGVPEWKKLWKNGWDLDLLNGYLSKHEKAFNLFDPDRPFMQNPNFHPPNYDLSENAHRVPVSRLFTELASGNNAQLADHHDDSTVSACSFSGVARALVNLQHTNIGFGVSCGHRPRYHFSPIASGASLLFCGKNLKETLMRNLVPVFFLKEKRGIPSDNDDPIGLPAWEREEDWNLSHRQVNGICDYLTWPSRYVFLIPVQNKVCHIYLAQGFIMEPEIFDLYQHAVQDKKGWKPLGFHHNKALWRDAHSLFNSFSDDEHLSPAINFVFQRYLLENEYLLEEEIPSVLITGVATDPGKAASILLWRKETFRVPIKLICYREKLEKLGDNIRIAEHIGGLIRRALYEYSKEYLFPNRDPDKDIVSRHRNALSKESYYWSTLETHFDKFLCELVEDSDTATQSWTETIQRAGSQTFELSLQNMDNTARGQRALQRASGYFYGSLKKTLKGDEA